MCAMKVPLLSRCFMATPPIIFDDVESSTGESATATLIGCDVTSTSSNVNVRKRNLLIHMRRKFFRSDRDYATAARQALGLDGSQVSESQSDCESVVTKGSVDIDCKRLYYQASSTRSLPQTKHNCNRMDGKKSDAISLPPKTSTRRRLSSVDSFSSAMDESCSGHSILDELLMEVYKDPYEDFLHKLKSSKKMEGKIEEIEVDVLTQLPAIKSNVSPKRMRSRRSITHHGASSARTAVPSRSNTCQDANTGPEGRDDENSKSKLHYDFLKNGAKEHAVGRTKLSSSSSVPGLRTSSYGVHSQDGRTEHRSLCGHEGPLKQRSIQNVPNKSRARVSHNNSYHARLEF